MRHITRRRALQEVALAAGAAGLTPILGSALPGWAADAAVAAPSQVVPFDGTHQAGIDTPQQAHACFASLAFTSANTGDLTNLLREWSTAARRMTEGRPASGSAEVPGRPPADSGEALGLMPANLTVTFGLGPGIFKLPGLGRLQPRLLRELPAFATDQLDPSMCGGDLAIQACADDPYVAFHAVRMLLAIGTSRVRLAWMLRGFLPSDQAAPGTRRNLMGFRDGTANPTRTEAVYNPTVWVQPYDEPGWLAGGSYLVTRRIRMLLGHWDASDFGEQQQTFGRVRGSGAPLSGGNEFTPPDYTAQANGTPVIAMDAHIRRASFAFNNGARILRRGYGFGDGTASAATGDQASGGIDAGLLFIAYMRDPGQFIRIQSSLATVDHLNEYILHVGSAIFAVPPGASDGGFVGETLLS